MRGGIAIGRPGPGRPRTRPGHVLADKAYSNRSIRGHLRRRGITATIPEPADQKANRARRGSRGGRNIGMMSRGSARRVSRIQRSVGVPSGISARPVKASNICGPPGKGGHEICSCFGAGRPTQKT